MQNIDHLAHPLIQRARAVGVRVELKGLPGGCAGMCFEIDGEWISWSTHYDEIERYVRELEPAVTQPVCRHFL